MSIEARGAGRCAQLLDALAASDFVVVVELTEERLEFAGVTSFVACAAGFRSGCGRTDAKGGRAGAGRLGQCQAGISAGAQLDT